MLIAQAEHEQNEAQLELLARPEAARRLATIAHLAGGQPRVWALLGPALQTSGIEALVQNLLARVDNLTPHYQEQLAHLSPQEARVVRRMAKHDRPLTVRGIAELAKLDQRSVGETISDLRRRGWITQYSSAITELADKRHSYYVLGEPLARSAFQLKESRGEPLPLVVEVIATWHDLDTIPNVEGVLADYLRDAPAFAPDSTTVTRGLSAIDSISTSTEVSNGTVVMLEAVDDAVLGLLDSDPRQLLALPTPIVELIEDKLIGRSLDNVRIDLARLATSWRIDWRQRIDRADIDDRWSYALRIAQEARFGSPAAVSVLVDEVATHVGSTHALTWAGRATLASTLMRSRESYERVARGSAESLPTRRSMSVSTAPTLGRCSH